MSDPISDAQASVDQARAALDRKVEEAVGQFEALIRDACDELLNKTVIEQHTITQEMNPADLATLKFNANSAVESAAAGVRAVVTSVDMDKLSAKAHVNSTGDSFVKYDDKLSALLRPLSDLLAKAGYRPVKSDLSSLTSYRHHLIERQLDSAIEAYGKANRVLEEAKASAGRDAARDAWGKA